MDISKLASRCGSVSRGHILYRMRGGYDSMMDNSCKKVDGKIYKTFPDTEDLEVEDLRDAEMDYVMLLWTDFANNKRRDEVTLKDRNI